MTLGTQHNAAYRHPTTVGKIFIRTVALMLTGAVVFLGVDRQPAYKPAPNDSPFTVAVTRVCGHQVCP